MPTNPPWPYLRSRVFQYRKQGRLGEEEGKQKQASGGRIRREGENVAGGPSKQLPNQTERDGGGGGGGREGGREKAAAAKQKRE